MIYLDTHAVAWLYAGLTERFEPAILDVMSGERLLVSPMVELELQYLLEIGRITEGGRTVLSDLELKIGLNVCHQPFHKVIATALSQDWTRDPFDRLIVAQALLSGAPLLTKDQHIRDHYPQAFWTHQEFAR